MKCNDSVIVMKFDNDKCLTDRQTCIYVCGLQIMIKDKKI